MLPRRVQAELLDGLAATDPVAERSRRDLQFLHRFMGTRTQLVRSLRQVEPKPGMTLRVLELGAGDGSLLLGVARDLAPVWPPVELTLMDRLPLVDGATVTEYARYGWSARSSRYSALKVVFRSNRYDRPSETAVLLAPTFASPLGSGPMPLRSSA